MCEAAGEAGGAALCAGQRDVTGRLIGMFQMCRLVCGGSCFEPATKGVLTLSGPFTEEKIPNTDVLIKRRPANPLAFPNEPPICSFALCRMKQPRVPGKGNRNNSPIGQVGGDLVTRHLDVLDRGYESSIILHRRNLSSFLEALRGYPAPCAAVRSIPGC